MHPDRIEREIVIRASVERVWSLVTQPGLWVTTGGPGDRRARLDFDLDSGALLVPEGAGRGGFQARIERVDPPWYLAYRWASAFPGEEPGEGNSTLVEFTLERVGDATRLRVTESGFAALAASEEARRQALDDNTGGWGIELERLRQGAERRAA